MSTNPVSAFLFLYNTHNCLSDLIVMSTDFHGRVGEAKVSDCDMHGTHGTITIRA